jgi:hypothetical protein
MKAMNVDLHEMENHGGFSFCCGGGGGVIDIERAAPLRYRTMEVKLREIDATGAETSSPAARIAGAPLTMPRRISPGTRHRKACWNWWPPTSLRRRSPT